jgi:hypothetical protein
MLGQEVAAPRQDTQAGARPAFFISNFRTRSFQSGCTFFGRENGKSVFQMIATFSLTTSSQRQSLILLERSSTEVGFYRV